MSSEEEDAPGIWQNSNMNWDQSFDFYEMPPSQESQEQLPPGNQTYPQPEDDEDFSDPSLLSWEGLRPIGRRFSFVIVPLLFAIVICIITLPFTLTQAVHVSFLPMIFLLIALAVAQGTMLYYAGSNDSLWLLSVMGGFCLFVLLGSYAIFGLGFSIFLLFVLFILSIVIARRSIRPVPEGRVDIVHSFGKYKRTLFPGFNLIMPWERISGELNVRETLWSCPKQRVRLLQSGQEVELIATISYQLMPEDAHLAVFHVKDWETSLHDLFVTTIHHDINELSPADFTAPHRKSQEAALHDPSTTRLWDRISAVLWQHMQDQVAHWGVQVNWVQIRDMNLLPHIPAKADMLAGNARPMNAGAMRGAGSVPSQPAHANVIPNQQFGRPQPAQPGAAPAAPANPLPPQQPTPAAGDAGGTVTQGAQNEALMDAYEAVRNGYITDPESIRQLAQRFLDIENNPAASDSFPYDAGRAARTLIRQAKWYEDQASAGDIYEANTQADMPRRRRANDNLMAGG